MQVIVSDIDGTVLDVSARTAACLREIGVPFDDPLTVSRGLRGKESERFYDLFLGTKYIDLDTPIPGAIDQIMAIMESTALPLVYLSGRLTSVQRPTRKALESIGLPFEALVLRPFRYRFKRSGEWKVLACARPTTSPYTSSKTTRRPSPRSQPLSLRRPCTTSAAPRPRPAATDANDMRADPSSVSNQSVAVCSESLTASSLMSDTSGGCISQYRRWHGQACWASSLRRLSELLVVPDPKPRASGEW